MQTGTIPWWVPQVVVPAAFTVLGALIGFAAARLKDWMEAREIKAYFLKAIRLELSALREQLEASVLEVDNGRERFRRGGAPPDIAGTLRTTVFSSQLSKLKDLSDPVLIEVVSFYSDVEVLRQLIASLGRRAGDYAKAVSGTQVRSQLESEIHSVARVLSEKLTEFIGRIEKLLPKLPSDL